ncbi:hypothetical protein HWQ46_11295 [Shewanella sp. D64]|uniref:hypothetical protein n=1 Tax=unclassified Shewanella TaxID=196818 RepID=UPI0022BA545C|nr:MULTISPECIES: hypothetical protein [unclassified Shewanella]MEC4726134.1 hypothetical protein [Shewanella sp. D64]MEC4737950.1 hypothetical protein [Shewanella sp. E94]WBJ98070.1 hypothetical protein HWQ47_03185 [Shewanella sp. MTB7]
MKNCFTANTFTFLLMLAPLLVTNTASASEQQKQEHQFTKCSRISNYVIYLSGINVGIMNRTEAWQGKTAVVTSTSEASILGIGTHYEQRAELSWSNINNVWLTDTFHQKVTGFRSRDMQVTFANHGLESRVDIDGDIDTYKSAEIPLRDVDTLAIQIREYLLQGRKQFALIRQASDAIESYQFYVEEVQTANIEPWGELTLIPVVQTGAEDVTYYFAPAMDYQLIKAKYHGIILQGLIELDSYTSSCELSVARYP